MSGRFSPLSALRKRVVWRRRPWKKVLGAGVSVTIFQKMAALIGRKNDHLELKLEFQVLAVLCGAQAGIELIAKKVLRVEGFSHDFKDRLLHVGWLNIRN